MVVHPEGIIVILLKKYLTFGLFCMAIALTTVLTGCGGNPVEESLNKVITEYGGAENLKKLNSHKLMWDMNAVSRGDKGRDIRFVVLPNKLRVELQYTNSAESRIINGAAGARGSSVALSMVSGPPLDAMKLQRMRLYSPLTLLSKKDELVISESGPYTVLTLKEGTLTGNYYINNSTNRIDRFVGEMTMPGAPGGAKMEFVTEYSDFEVIEGVLLAKREVKFAGGVNTAVLALSGYKFNAEFAPEFFDLPSSK